MGNFEKLVVLTVLFLAATILGISMHGDGEPRSNSPLGEGDEGTGTLSSLVEQPGTGAEAPEQPPVAPEQPTTEPDTDAETDEVPVVVPEVVPAQPTVIEASAPVVGGSDERPSPLVNTEGLKEPFVGSEYLYYTLQPGDKIFALAERFYGSRGYHELLRQANSGADLKVGDDILVPRYDILAEAQGHVAKDPAPAHDAPVEVPTTTTKSRTVTVAEGDSLWSIAVEVYGQGSRWGELYKANRHQLESEHDLELGMELIIP